MKPQRLYTLLIYISVSLLSLTAQASRLPFKSYMAVDGLSDNSVLCGLRDSYGFMWFGTSNGLNCFDGQHNTVYRNMVSSDVSFENNLITSLLEQDDDIWFGGSFGLYVYHRQQNTFTRFRVKTKYGVVISSTVQHMDRTPNGLVWICTLGQGIFFYDTKSGTLLQDSRHNAFITDMVLASDGRVYLTTLDGHLMVYSTDGHYERQYTIPDYVSDKSRTSIARVATRLYVGCDQGLYCLNTQTDALEPVSITLDAGIRSLLDKNGSLLLGTEHGLYSFDVSTSETCRLDDPATGKGLSDDLINELLTDVDGTLWVLTEHGGVCYQAASPENMEVINLPAKSNENARNMVRAFIARPDGSAWIGADAGLYLYSPFQGTTVQPQLLPQMPGEVNALLSDGDDLWVGTQHDGLFVVNTLTGSRRHYVYSDDRPYTLPSNAVRCLLRTRSGDIYVGTSWGLRRFDRKTEQFMGFLEINSMTAFVSLTEDTQGNIWAASANHGLFCKKRGSSSFTNYVTQSNDEHSLPSNALTCVYCDQGGTVWVAVKEGGCCRYNAQDNTFERFSVSDPLLAQQRIYFFQEDAQQVLWLGTENGLIRIEADREHFSEAVSFPDDKQREQKPYNAVCRLSDGQILMGSNGNLLSMNPTRFQLSPKPRPVYIIALSLPYVADGKKELANKGLDHPLYTSERINLTYSDNSFTLHFASPCFNHRRQLRYEYMLKGFDKAWARGTENAEATYTNMPPGTYEFLLREAGNEDAESYARLRLTVMPPWYRTTWAYGVYVILFFIALFFSLRRANRTFRRRYDKRMEEFRLTQEKENFQSKINFFINLVHEIRTPLSLVSLPLEQMEDGELSEENRRHVTSIRRNMNYLLGITNQLLDFQKAENGKVILNLTNCNIAQLMQKVCSQFDDAMQAQGKRLQLQVPEQPIVSALDTDKVTKMLMNLLGNAMKYARTEVILRLEQTDDEHFRISVIDDGPGIPKSEREHIFDVYYQIAGDDTAATLGTGLGLAYAKMLARAHDGDLDEVDSIGGGSNFMLTLPIKRSNTTATSPLQESIISAADPALPEESQADSDASTSTAGSFGEQQTKTGTSHRILVVEDNEELLNSICEGLRKWYRVLKARNGEEALEVLRYHDVDIVVSDVMMPRMDGNELCRTIRSDINFSHLPVILLTAKTAVEAKVEGMQSGADIYLEKPFSMKQLHLQIQNILRMRQNFHQRMRQLDGMVLPEENTREYGLNEQDQKFLLRLTELIEQNLRDEEFSIDVLAEQMNMSRSSFYRKIKALTDQTPIDYLKTQRLERAAQLIRKGERITEVASQVGFTSSSYFAKCFRAKYGVLPKEYAASEQE
ncbi:MAG: response regulator [Bacteroidaceae bacterium]|nr:response regulator [Bacteroidaceae bacterium]